MELDQLLDILESDLRMYVAEFARRRLFVHAGVVGWHGQAIVVAGRSYSGKTTLVRELVRAGATYYSDEYAVFDARGYVYPYPTPLSIREVPDSPPRRYPVEELGGVQGLKPLPVGMVLLGRYRERARWRPRPLSPGRAVLQLLTNTVAARQRPDGALATLLGVVAHARVLQGVRGEAEPIASAVLNGVDGRSSVPHGSGGEHR